MDRRIGVLGPVSSAGSKALFLRTYSRYVTLFATDGEGAAQPQVIGELRQAGVKLAANPMKVEHQHGRAVVTCKDGTQHTVDVLYPALAAQSAPTWRSVSVPRLLRSAILSSMITRRHRLKACTRRGTSSAICTSSVSQSDTRPSPRLRYTMACRGTFA